MNERIFELAQQAENYATTRHPMSNIALSVNSEKFVKKFAELIVEECIQSIEKTIDTNCDSDSEKMGCEFAITDLKEHFGVE